MATTRGGSRLPRRRRWAPGPLGLLVLVLTGPMCLQSLREDELECEEAMAHLDGCCPDFDLDQVECTHGFACSDVTPDLAVSESQCIRELDCEQIRERDLCQRVVDIVPDGWGGGEPGQEEGPEEREALCP